LALRCHSVAHYEHAFENGGSCGLGEPFPDRRVILFDPRIERGSQSIGERWRQLDASKRAVDLVIVRGSGEDFASEVEGDDVLRDLVGETPLLVLAGSWDAENRSPALSRPSWAAERDTDVELDEIRNYELATLVLESGAVYRESGCHFLLPSSSYHAEAFIRLADALDDHTDLVRLADWVLPLLDADTALLGDNGSLLGLLGVVSREALSRFGWHLAVATFNQYPSDNDSIRSFIDGFRAQDWKRLLFLVTVSSSGSIAGRVEALREEGVDVEVAILCGTDPPGDGPQCFARHLVERWKVEVNERCRRCGDLQTLIIDPQTYEVRTSMHSVREGIDIEEAKRCAPFWEAADQQDAVALHVWVQTADGNPAGNRHLAIAIDVEALLRDSWFRERCLLALRRQPTPDLALIPRHDSTAALRELIAEAHGIDPAKILDLEIGDFEDPVLAALSESKRLLVADEVVITAETMVTLRRRAYEAKGGLEIWGFTPLLRPPSTLERRHLFRPFQGPGAEGEGGMRFASGFELSMPPPGPGGCPWCAEMDLLETRLTNLSGPPRELAEERVARLRSNAGFGSPLLLRGDTPGTRTEGSYFGELRPEAAFAAASAVAQHQKDAFQRDRGVNELRYFNVPLAIEALYDTVLLGGMLRTFERRDLREIGRDEEVGRALGEYQLDEAGLVEAAYAAITGKLPARPVVERLQRSDLGQAGDLLLALLDAA
jgi:hypothetical protein